MPVTPNDVLTLKRMLHDSTLKHERKALRLAIAALEPRVTNLGPVQQKICLALRESKAGMTAGELAIESATDYDVVVDSLARLIAREIVMEQGRTRATSCRTYKIL